MPKKKSYSDGYIQSLWRKAVFLGWGKKCALCGSQDRVEAHHVKSRRHRVLRHDLRNGIPLCGRCHQKADTHQVREEIRKSMYPMIDWLDEMEQVTLADFCSRANMTKSEFYLEQVDTLKAYIQHMEGIVA